MLLSKLVESGGKVDNDSVVSRRKHQFPLAVYGYDNVMWLFAMLKPT